MRPEVDSLDLAAYYMQRAIVNLMEAGKHLREGSAGSLRAVSQSDLLLAMACAVESMAEELRPKPVPEPEPPPPAPPPLPPPGIDAVREVYGGAM